MQPTERQAGESEVRPVWNSLEVAKLLVSFLMPIAVATSGFFIQRQLALDSAARAKESRLLDRRLTLYDSVKVPLNRIFCYIEEIGTWKEDTPLTIIEFKRRVDTTMYVDEPMWTPAVMRAYQDYEASAFKHFQGVASDAAIRAAISQKSSLPSWDKSWERKFAPYDDSHKDKYKVLMQALAKDLRLSEEQK